MQFHCDLMDPEAFSSAASPAVEYLPDEARDGKSKLYEDVWRVSPEPSTNPKCPAIVNNNIGTILDFDIISSKLV